MAKKQPWYREHSLFIAFVLLYLVFQGLALWAGHFDWNDLHGQEQPEFWQGFAHDTYGWGALAFLGKWFRERGSPDAKEPEDPNPKEEQKKG